MLTLTNCEDGVITLISVCSHPWIGRNTNLEIKVNMDIIPQHVWINIQNTSAQIITRVTIANQASQDLFYCGTVVFYNHPYVFVVSCGSGAMPAVSTPVPDVERAVAFFIRFIDLNPPPHFIGVEAVQRPAFLVSDHLAASREFSLFVCSYTDAALTTPLYREVALQTDTLLCMSANPSGSRWFRNTRGRFSGYVAGVLLGRNVVPYVLEYFLPTDDEACGGALYDMDGQMVGIHISGTLVDCKQSIPPQWSPEMRSVMAGFKVRSAGLFFHGLPLLVVVEEMRRLCLVHGEYVGMSNDIYYMCDVLMHRIFGTDRLVSIDPLSLYPQD